MRMLCYAACRMTHMSMWRGVKCSPAAISAPRRRHGQSQCSPTPPTGQDSSRQPTHCTCCGALICCHAFLLLERCSTTPDDIELLATREHIHRYGRRLQDCLRVASAWKADSRAQLTDSREWYGKGRESGSDLAGWQKYCHMCDEGCFSDG